MTTKMEWTNSRRVAMRVDRIIPELKRLIDLNIKASDANALMPNFHVGMRGVRFYFRNIERRFPGVVDHLIPCIDLGDANIDEDLRGYGIFRSVVEHLETTYGTSHALYMENILNDDILKFFKKRFGYQLRYDLRFGSYYRLPTST